LDPTKRKQRKREISIEKKAHIPKSLAINDQETFSGTAPILGLSAMHERHREQFAGDKW